MENLGICGKVNRWIEGFLKKRKQLVVVRGCQSQAIWCTSGVQQGSVLGPLLFIILMHDINKGILHSILSSFADDTKVWKAITSIHDEIFLQDDLDLIYRWAEENNMEFNSDKFQAIRFAALFSETAYSNDSGADIDQHEIVKDLGIYISQDLSFDQHIRTVANKGKRMAGWILRTFTTRRRDIMLTLLKQLIYPTVEYNSVLWNPSDQTLIDLLESVQNNFLKRIYSPTLAADADYWDRLKHFKLYSLQRRRERYMIMCTWKVIHGIYPNPGLHLNHTTTDHSGHPNQGVSMNITNSGEIQVHHDGPTLPGWLESKSVLKTCCELYNSLPRALRATLKPEQEPSFANFKTVLDKWLTTIPDRPTSARRPRMAASNSIIHMKAYAER